MGLAMMAAKNLRWSWAFPALLIPAALIILWQELGLGAQAAVMAPDRVVAVSTQPLAGAGTMIGPLRLLAAVQLASPDPGFGGISGLAARDDRDLVAVTDAGQWLALSLGFADGRLAGIARARMASFAAGAEKSDLDAEAIVLSPGGRTLISMEQRHRILVLGGQEPPFRPEGTIFRTMAADWPSNGGGETLALLPDGHMLWVSEQARLPDGHATALLTGPDNRTRGIGVPVPDGFSPTDAAVLDGQRLLVLHRKFDGLSVAAAITLVDLAPVLAGGGTANMRLLAKWDAGSAWPIDNMEGLTLVRTGGRTLLYVVSDDNFSAAQRTILLQLELVGPLDQPSP